MSVAASGDHGCLELSEGNWRRRAFFFVASGAASDTAPSFFLARLISWFSALAASLLVREAMSLSR